MSSKIFHFALCFLAHVSFSQQMNVHGVISDSITSEALSGATIRFGKSDIQVLSDANGHFMLEIPPSLVSEGAEFRIVLLGYVSKEIALLPSKEFYEITLTPASKLIREVRVKTPKENLSSLTLPLALARKIPMLGGEADVIKAFQFMPGVAGGSEGSSALYVRGGSPDQNLFLLDQIPLYYVSHIGGFVSTFDPNMIGSVQLHKGNFPARYNGRLSSVVDIHMRNGNKYNTKSEVSVGLLTTKFQMDGPFKKDSSWTYLLSVRRFNFDLLVRMLARLDSGGNSTAGYTFYDANVKVVKRFQNKAVLSMFYYDGRDRIFVRGKEKSMNGEVSSYTYNTTWGNRLLGVNYIKPISAKLMANLTVGSTNFYYATKIQSSYSPSSGASATKNVFLFQSTVNDALIKCRFNRLINENLRLEFGSNSTLHYFRPGNLRSQNQTSTVELKSSILAFQQSFFGELRWNLSSDFNMQLGSAVNIYTVGDTCFIQPEPRISFTYDLKQVGMLQLGFSKMQQNLHYVSYSGSSLPTDLWLPATKDFRPEQALQANLSYRSNLNLAKIPFELTVEGFYKDLKNLLDFKEGISFYSTSALETKLEKNGRGHMYGFEFMLEKSSGKTTGWIAYTWSKNMRQFDNINDGKEYPFKYDRRHNISLIVNHEFSKRIQFTASWVYSTGNAITMSQGYYNQLDIVNSNINDGIMYNLGQAQLYTEKNGYRMPAYHRMDISIQFKKDMLNGQRIWSFSIYNVYNHMNPFYLFYDKNDQGVTTLHQLTIFPFIPAFNYQFRFLDKK